MSTEHFSPGFWGLEEAEKLGIRYCYRGGALSERVVYSG